MLLLYQTENSCWETKYFLNKRTGRTKTVPMHFLELHSVDEHNIEITWIYLYYTFGNDLNPTHFLNVKRSMLSFLSCIILWFKKSSRKILQLTSTHWLYSNARISLCRFQSLKNILMVGWHNGQISIKLWMKAVARVCSTPNLQPKFAEGRCTWGRCRFLIDSPQSLSASGVLAEVAQHFLLVFWV